MRPSLSHAGVKRSAAADHQVVSIGSESSDFLETARKRAASTANDQLEKCRGRLKRRRNRKDRVSASAAD